MNRITDPHEGFRYCELRVVNMGEVLVLLLASRMIEKLPISFPVHTV